MPGAVEFDSLFTTLETSARAIRKVAEENAHALMAPIRLSALVGNTARASRSRTRGPASRLTCCRRFSRAMYPTDRRPARAPPVARILGLGLAIVRRNIELMGGRVSARNRPEGGIEVTLSLPIAN